MPIALNTPLVNPAPSGSQTGFVESFMALQPLYDRVVIKRVDAETKTTGGILLPDNAQNKPQKGVITAVGAGKQLKDGSIRPLQVKVGDTVLFTVWAGEEYKDRVTTGELVIMREEDILAVLDK
jgi:chaperonin GroES